ncbi:MAG: ABC transporter permease [Chloroflexi bacterium]|nr:ABC transporter permease [Chloroflexota bacterium]
MRGIRASDSTQEKVVVLQSMTASSRAGRVIGSLRRSPAGMLGFAIVAVVIICALFAPFITPHDPTESNLRARYMPPGYTDSKGTYLLGTDQLGRDILSRIIAGSGVSVLVGVVAVIIAGTVGVLYGLISGFIGGWLDSAMMRFVDALLGIPFIILVVSISGIIGAGLATLILILGLTGWVTYARVIRGEVLKTRSLDYILAAYAIGQTRAKIMFMHILPNVVSTAIVLAATQVGVTILAESSLSFLGLGVKPPEVTWGVMLADGRQYISSAWWMTTYPGIAITITVLGVVFLGDWLRDILDPKVRGRP